MFLSRSAVYNYFDIEEISINEEVIPAVFLVSSFTLAGEVPVTPLHDEDGDDENDTDILPPHHRRSHPHLSSENSGPHVTSSSWISQGQRSASGPSYSSTQLFKDVKEGQTAFLPLWAAIPLHREGYIRGSTPPSFALSTFREFKADPLAPSLYLKSPFFFDAGIRICRLLGTPTSSGAMSSSGSRLVAQLVRLYQLRYLKIIQAARKRGFDLSDIRDGLAESERYLLDTVLTGQAEEREWNNSLL